MLSSFPPETRAMQASGPKRSPSYLSAYPPCRASYTALFGTAQEAGFDTFSETVGDLCTPVVSHPH